MTETQANAPTTSGTGRALRADARRNRERVLAAAQAAFAAEGISVPLDEIARRAGVGPGTVYRHFPTKEALFHAAMLDRVERMVAQARDLADAEDPGRAFFDYLDLMVVEGGVKRDLAEAVGGHESLENPGPTVELLAAIDVLLRRAQSAGATRTDIDIDDLMRILKGGFLSTHTTGANAEQRRRTFAVLFDGLRPR
ncbi:TetR/AcrR family transcriptional regulator [Nocardia miyunensis]|uniref:TetR/AcrR family transcriptional regulator n=1 Tax=Nocardia miyunensis TaxID=282684 RepID=UPI00082D0F7A|nr:TetR/AcrR family transcriptional regulator [Nocardia miyunensis]